jgi:hypothetical protein
MPDGNWKVLRTEGHTTIYSDTYKLFFDLLVWRYLNGKASTYNQLFGNEHKPSADDESVIEGEKMVKKSAIK